MRITVLMHEKDPVLEFYLLGALCDVWRSQGHEIVEQHGVGRPVEGDLVFLHVDLTVVPDEYLRAVEDHPRVVNRRAVDISKTGYSRIRVHSPDEWDGPVIVKTVRNHGGHPERRSRRGTLIGRLRNGADKVRALSLAHAQHLDPNHYPVFDSARDVPRRVFSNRALMVERFVPEMQGEYYTTRVYSFLGDRFVTQIRGSLNRLPTHTNATSWREAPLRNDVEALAKEMGFEYGRFDHVVHDGQMILLDANRTVGIPRIPEIRRRRIEELAPGLESLMR